MRIGRAFLLWCVLMLSYLLLAGASSATEIGAGAVSCAVVMGLALLIHRGERRVLRARPPLPVLGRTALALVVDTARVAGALIAAILHRPAGRAGRLEPVPFRTGTEHPADAGRRAIVTLAASLAPNGFVLAVPGGGDRLLMHTLAPAGTPSDRDWPV